MSYQVQTFKAASTAEALALVRRALGPDAVILGTRHVESGGLPGLVGRRRVEITAASGDMPSIAPRLRNSTPASASMVTPADSSAAARCYVALVQAEVAVDLARRISAQAAAALPSGTNPQLADVQRVLRDEIARMVPATPAQRSTGTPLRLAVIGPSGAGKTTTIAKLAVQFAVRQRLRVAILSLDTLRPGANESLRRYAAAIGAALATAQSPAEVDAQLCALAPFDVLLIDTPGVGPRDADRRAHVGALLKSAAAQETHLVLPASMAESAQVRAAESLNSLRATRIIFTRLDEAVGFGVIVNVIERLGLAPSYFSRGQNVSRDLESACGRVVADLLFARRGQEETANYGRA